MTPGRSREMHQVSFAVSGGSFELAGVVLTMAGGGQEVGLAKGSIRPPVRFPSNGKSRPSEYPQKLRCALGETISFHSPEKVKKSLPRGFSHSDAALPRGPFNVVRMRPLFPASDASDPAEAVTH
jgi:hypothetical protein